MKLLIFLLTQTLAVISTFGQGLVHFANNSATLISVNGSPMPANQIFVFAVFFAPSTTVIGPGQPAPSLFDPAYVLGGYATNSSLALGRIERRLAMNVGPASGTSVDFVIRGWSAYYGYTWEEALPNLMSFPLSIYPFGQSTVGDNFLIGGGLVPVSDLMSLSAVAVQGFNLKYIPEPSSLVILVLSLSLVTFKRFRKVE